MRNFKALKDTCRDNSDLFSHVVEEFLFRNVVNHQKFAEETKIRFAPYRHVTREFQDGWVNMLMMQYIIHSILKKDGLISKYLNHSAIQRLKEHERDYLKYLSAHPWKFSFSIITKKHPDSFFEMEDAFTGESFLLYSPGIGDILQDTHITLWLNLIGFNGECWQSYGPIGAYQAFTPDDIFFYASELNPRKFIETDEDIIVEVENNPVPFMMLLSGASYPITAHENDVIVQAVAEYDLENFDTHGFEKDFTIEYSNHVYRLTLKKWSGHPHFSAAYYDESRKVLSLNSMTDRGFRILVDRLNKLGYDLDPDPDIRVTMAMSVTANKILKREIRLNEYEHLFKKEEPAEATEEIEKINVFLSLALPEINAGRQPDFKSLARKAGIDEETANSVLKQITGKTDNTKKFKK